MGTLDKLGQRFKVFKSEPIPWSSYLTYLWLKNKIRSAYYARLLKAPALNIGSGCSIRGLRCIKIGRNVSIYGGLWLEALNNYRGQRFDPTILIGDGVSFSKDVHVTCVKSVVIGSNVLFGSRVYVSDHNHGRYSGINQSYPDTAPADRELALGGAVVIEDNVWIGDNVVILGPARIGAGSVVAANSVVKGDIPSATMIAGAPAKAIRRFDAEMKIWKKI
jgi:acetyltransferase-like isoleucine patch superfamily enzyme